MPPMKTLISVTMFIARAIGQDILSPDRSEDCATRHRAGRNGMIFCAVVALILLAAKCHSQPTFRPPADSLPPNAPHLSAGDTALGADPKRGLGPDNLPEATEERFMAFGGILFASAYLWAYWYGKKQKH